MSNKPLSFKDFVAVDYLPGTGEYVSWQAHKRKRGAYDTQGESVEQVDEARAPSTVKHKGKTYYQTGKKGKDMKTGAPSFEYSSNLDGDDVRVWYNTKTKKATVESFEQVDEGSLRKRIAQLSSKFPERSKVKTSDGKRGTVLSVGKDYVKVGHGTKTKDYHPSKLTRESVEQVDEADLRKMDHDKFMKYGDSNPKGRADPAWNAERKRRYKNSQASMYRKMKKEEVEQIEGKNTPNDGNPCWDTHKKVGTKMKGGKRVNDCVPKNESTVDEALTHQQRVKASIRMKKMASRIKMGRERAAKRTPTMDVVKKRAFRKARLAVLKKMTKGQTKDELSFSRRADIEKKLAKKTSLIQRLAKKLIPDVRKKDRERRAAK